MSGTSLFVLSGEYRAAAEALANLDLDEATVADTLESLSGDLEVKAQNVAMFALNLEAAVKAINDHTRAQQERAKAIEKRAESLRAYLASCLTAAGIEKVEWPGGRISFRKSAAVIIDGPDLIPDDLMRKPEPTPAAPDKKAIAEAIKAGRAVPGAHIESRKTLHLA